MNKKKWNAKRSIQQNYAGCKIIKMREKDWNAITKQQTA